MADSYTQIYIQLIFVVKYRQAHIRPEWEEELYKYITGIVQKRGHKMMAINGMPDHTHLLVGFKPAESLSHLVQETKKASTNFINDNQFCPQKFQWQAGYAAFSYSKSHVERVYWYIQNQKAHHRKRTFREEFSSFLKAYEIETGRKRPFDFWEN